MRARDEQAESSPFPDSDRAMVRADEAESGPLSLRERVRVRADQAQAASSAPARHRPTVKTLLIGLGFLGAIAAAFAAGVLITINRNGEKYQVEVPKDSHTVVDDNGNVIVNIPGKPQGGKPSAANPAAELNALMGQWKVMRVERQKGLNLPEPWQSEQWGTMAPEDVDRLDFKEKTLRIADLRKGTALECDYRVDPTAAPKTIDLVQPPRAVPGAVPGNEQCIAVGIYEMDGDRLKVCLRRYLPSLKTQPRPSRFAVKPNTGDVLLVLERHRLSEDEKAIQGWWAVATQVEDGKSVPNAQVRNIQFSFYDDMDFGIDSSGNQGRGGTVGQSDATGLWSLDPAKHPKTITLFAFYPFGGKKDLLGIFKFTDKELHIAYRQGGPRPEKFESARARASRCWCSEKWSGAPGFPAARKPRSPTNSWTACRKQTPRCQPRSAPRR